MFKDHAKKNNMHTPSVTLKIKLIILIYGYTVRKGLSF